MPLLDYLILLGTLLVVVHSGIEYNSRSHRRKHGVAYRRIRSAREPHRMVPYAESLDFFNDNSALSSWSAWSKCNRRRCIQRRTRRRCAKHDPYCKKRKKEVEKRRCESPRCLTKSPGPIEQLDRYFAPWSSWSSCSAGCEQTRTRRCRRYRYCQTITMIDNRTCSDRKCNGIHEYYDYDTYNDRDNDTAVTVPASFSTCGIRSIKSLDMSLRIIGGRVSRRGSWPWQVAILRSSRHRYHQYCGGTLIAPQWVLTAAHCITKKGRRLKIVLKVGEHDLETEEGTEQYFIPEQDYIHENFDRNTVDSDIALLKLNKPVMNTAYATSACLPEVHETLATGSQCYVTGWGKTYQDGLRGSEELREARVPIVSQDKCQQAFSYNVSRNQFCAGDDHGGRDSCEGDSGGPLLCSKTNNGTNIWYVYGVTSFGDGCGVKGKFGIYTKVSNFVTWIYETIAKDQRRTEKIKYRKSGS